MEDIDTDTDTKIEAHPPNSPASIIAVAAPRYGTKIKRAFTEEHKKIVRKAMAVAVKRDGFNDLRNWCRHYGFIYHPVYRWYTGQCIPSLDQVEPFCRLTKIKFSEMRPDIMETIEKYG